jgi:cysteinyl-tRNA synthetase
VLGIGLEEIRQRSASETLPAEIEAMRAERDEARRKKDFRRSDELRKELQSRGYEVKDTPSGTVLQPRN